MLTKPKAIPLPNRVQALREYSVPAAELLAEGFTWKLDENYSFLRGPNRTGAIRKDTGRRESKPGEMPQEQTGLLRSAIFFEEISGRGSSFISFKAGLSAEASSNPNELMEYLAYIEGWKPVTASRFGLEMTGESEETHKAMATHLRQYLDKSRLVRRA